MFARYEVAFWPAAGAVLLGSLILWPVRHRLVHKTEAKKAQEGAAGGVLTSPLIADVF